MAKFSGASGSLYLNVYIDQGTQNIANNTTVVNWRMTVSHARTYLADHHGRFCFANGWSDYGDVVIFSNTLRRCCRNKRNNNPATFLQ